MPENVRDGSVLLSTTPLAIPPQKHAPGTLLGSCISGIICLVICSVCLFLHKIKPELLKLVKRFSIFVYEHQLTSSVFVLFSSYDNAYLLEQVRGSSPQKDIAELRYDFSLRGLGEIHQ